jgi:hypothetical protein
LTDASFIAHIMEQIATYWQERSYFKARRHVSPTNRDGRK